MMPKYKLVTKKKANDIRGFITFIYSLKRTENQTTLTAQNAKEALQTFKPIQMVSSFDLESAPIIINYDLFFNDCLDHKFDYLIGLI